MTEESMGASAEADRAFVPSASSPQAVSPVPASIPCVGDRLFVVERRRGHLRGRSHTEWVSVSKVGRKWLTLQCENGREWGRCDRKDLRPDTGDYSARHTIYRSEGEFREITSRNSAWKKLREIIRSTYSAPDHLDPDDIERMCNLITAKAIEAHRAETGTGSVEDESAVPAGHSPEPSIPSTTTKEVGE